MHTIFMYFPEDYTFEQVCRLLWVNAQPVYESMGAPDAITVEELMIMYNDDADLAVEEGLLFHIPQANIDIELAPYK